MDHPGGPCHHPGSEDPRCLLPVEGPCVCVWQGAWEWLGSTWWTGEAQGSLDGKDWGPPLGLLGPLPSWQGLELGAWWVQGPLRGRWRQANP